MGDSRAYEELGAVAIIGMAGRFPKSRDLAEFWRNLCEGADCITRFSREDVVATSYTRDLLDKPNYVGAAGALDDIDLFDARFFGISPREVQGMDPQHRVFLEVAVEALQIAGYDPARAPGPIGVYAGCDDSTYFVNNLLANPEFMMTVGPFAAALGSDKDYLPTRVSYELDLRGPSVSIQCACSTALAATHIAIQGLLEFECDLALAGGVAIRVPQKMGYLAQEGGVFAPDGRCRPFDESGGGFVEGSGAGILVLKRMEDALADGDHIWAVIRGSALNNDGRGKMGFAAPKRESQAAVIAAAHAAAEVEPASITYVEAHGTGTRVGDPLEFGALDDIFRPAGVAPGSCGIGSVKSNIGHLFPAAGAASLIKTALALENRTIPPTINFRRPNPEIRLEGSPFRIVTDLESWPEGPTPRRAGVSAFGIGGTNAHVILEEAPPPEPSGPSREEQLLVLSAKTSTALAAAAERLRAVLAGADAPKLADAAFTLQHGRTAYAHRRAVVCRDAAEAVEALASGGGRRVAEGFRKKADRPVAFLFTGQGSQYAGMGRDLYGSEAVYRETLDRCAELLRPHLGLDLREVLHAAGEAPAEADEALRQTALTQPALFAVEYSLARLWQSWGVAPSAMIGHSIGEYVAACLAGVFDLEQALGLVAVRGRLMQELPSGSMMAVLRPEAEVAGWLADDLSVAAVNSSSTTIVSGSDEAVAALEERLAGDGVATRRLRTSHAFHSAMMDPILEAFTREVAAASPAEPRIPFVSNVTGDWIEPEEATDPGYWARHLRGAVRFAAGIETLVKGVDLALLEVGPGSTLGSLARQVPAVGRKGLVLASLPGPRDEGSDLRQMLLALGGLWAAGTPVDWVGFQGEERRRRVPLPTYPFERQRHWVDPQEETTRSRPGSAAGAAGKRADIADWFYLPSWRRSPAPALLPRAQAAEGEAWLVFCDGSGVGGSLAERLRELGGEVDRVTPGDEFSRIEEGGYRVRPTSAEDHRALFAALTERGRRPRRIVHCWSLSETRELDADRRDLWDHGLYALLALAAALPRGGGEAAPRIDVITSGAREVDAGDLVEPEKHALLGPCKVIPQEMPGTVVRTVDVLPPDDSGASRVRDRLVTDLVAELAARPDEPAVAYRHGRRWVETFDPVRLEAPAGTPSRLRQGGVYLVTGGLGNIGFALAERLAREVRARLVLTGRSPLPPREEWPAVLENSGSEDGVATKIRRIQALEEAGAEVLPVVADVADAEAMTRAFREAEERFGALDGVIHAAGSVEREAFQPVAALGREACEPILRAKVDGLRVLDGLLEGRSLDFCLLASSLSAVLGGLNYGAYAAANLYLNGFAQRCCGRSETPWISVGWDNWMHEPEEGGRAAAASATMSLAMTPPEGVETFFRVLDATPSAQWIVSTGDLEPRVDRWLRISPMPARPSEPEGPVREDREDSDLPADYEVPVGEIEETLASFWAKVLGTPRVGAEDDFFELGGHSLLAIQAVARVQEEFGVDLSMNDFFARPTVRALAAEVEARLIAEIDSLSDEDAERLLDDGS